MNLNWNLGPMTSVPAFALNLVLAAVLAALLGLAYVRFGHSLSNRRLFARNFLLLTLTTTLVISIVKSSLALSLGLVGALSIVRFRAAIKEPEELAFLFLAISIGLGLGANQPVLTAVAFVVIVGLFCLHRLLRRKQDQPNLYLTITNPGDPKLTVTQMLELLVQSGATAQLKRFDESPHVQEASFQVLFKEPANIEKFNQRLRELSAGVRVSYLEDRGLEV